MSSAASTVCEAAKRIRERNPGRVPIICEPYGIEAGVAAPRWVTRRSKFLVSDQLNIGQFRRFVRGNLVYHSHREPSETATNEEPRSVPKVSLYLRDAGAKEVIGDSVNIVDLDRGKCNPDGFLYLRYETKQSSKHGGLSPLDKATDPSAEESAKLPPIITALKSKQPKVANSDQSTRSDEPTGAQEVGDHPIHPGNDSEKQDNVAVGNPANESTCPSRDENPGHMATSSDAKAFSEGEPKEDTTSQVKDVVADIVSSAVSGSMRSGSFASASGSTTTLEPAVPESCTLQPNVQTPALDETNLGKMGSVSGSAKAPGNVDEEDSSMSSEPRPSQGYVGGEIPEALVHEAERPRILPSPARVEYPATDLDADEVFKSHVDRDQDKGPGSQAMTGFDTMLLSDDNSTGESDEGAWPSLSRSSTGDAREGHRTEHDVDYDWVQVDAVPVEGHAWASLDKGKAFLMNKLSSLELGEKASSLRNLASAAVSRGIRSRSDDLNLSTSNYPVLTRESRTAGDEEDWTCVSLEGEGEEDFSAGVDPKII